MHAANRGPLVEGLPRPAVRRNHPRRCHHRSAHRPGGALSAGCCTPPD